MTDFYVRYYVGHEGEFGHEFLEFEIRRDGRLRYTNNSQYKRDAKIRKEVWVSEAVLSEIRRMLIDGSVQHLSDQGWPAPGPLGKQELEVVLDDKAISLTTSKLGSMAEIAKTKDPDGLTKFFFLIHDLKNLIFTVINLHFRLKPI